MRLVEVGADHPRDGRVVGERERRKEGERTDTPGKSGTPRLSVQGPDFV